MGTFKTWESWESWEKVFRLKGFQCFVLRFLGGGKMLIFRFLKTVYFTVQVYGTSVAHAVFLHTWHKQRVIVLRCWEASVWLCRKVANFPSFPKDKKNVQNFPKFFMLVLANLQLSCGTKKQYEKHLVSATDSNKSQCEW